MLDSSSRSQQLDRAIANLLQQAPEIEAAAVVSFDGLPMASALPATMDEDRVAAMSAALLSLGERAAEGLGRGGLNQVYIEGESGTVYLVSAEDEAVLVAVAASGAKVGMMLYEVRRAAAAVASALRAEDDEQAVADEAYPTESYEAAVEAPYADVPAEPVDYDDYTAYGEYVEDAGSYPVDETSADVFVKPVVDHSVASDSVAEHVPAPTDPAWTSHLPTSVAAPAESQSWS
jgi:uncharacterized protein